MIVHCCVYCNVWTTTSSYCVFPFSNFPADRKWSNCDAWRSASTHRFQNVFATDDEIGRKQAHDMSYFVRAIQQAFQPFLDGKALKEAAPDSKDGQELKLRVSHYLMGRLEKDWKEVKMQKKAGGGPTSEKIRVQQAKQLWDKFTGALKKDAHAKDGLNCCSFLATYQTAHAVQEH